MKQLEYYLKKSALAFLRNLRGLLQKIEERKTLLIKLPGTRKVQPLINRYKLVFAIASAIVVCLILTSFSVFLYAVTGTAKLDLSRPGYEDVRQQVNRMSTAENSFEPSGPLSSSIINDYLKKYKKQSDALAKYDTFNPHLLDDAPLGLSATQIGPTDGTSP